MTTRELFLSTSIPAQTVGANEQGLTYGAADELRALRRDDRHLWLAAEQYGNSTSPSGRQQPLAVIDR